MCPLRCKIGFHVWDGCRCNLCGKIRDKGHRWVQCKCSLCGNIRDTEHQLEKCRCIICGGNFHDWDIISERYLGHKCEEKEHYGAHTQVMNLYEEWDEYEICKRCKVCLEERTVIDYRNYSEVWF
jgi:hypothetical protein